MQGHEEVRPTRFSVASYGDASTNQQLNGNLTDYLASPAVESANPAALPGGTQRLRRLTAPKLSLHALPRTSAAGALADFLPEYNMAAAQGIFDDSKDEDDLVFQLRMLPSPIGISDAPASGQPPQRRRARQLQLDTVNLVSGYVSQLVDTDFISTPSLVFEPDARPWSRPLLRCEKGDGELELSWTADELEIRCMKCFDSPDMDGFERRGFLPSGPAAGPQRRSSCTA
jgi:hypothetical protein